MRFISYLLATTFITACGQVSYKMGGSPRDIALAHQSCRGSGELLAACLEKEGWQKPQVDLFDPLFATVTTTDNRQPDPNKANIIIDIPPQKTVATVASDTSKTVAENTKTSASGVPITEAQTARSTINDGPEVEYSINSWWKMGGFPEQLAKDQRSCEQKLDAKFMPDYKTQTYKRGFIVCMHDLGWMAIRNLK